MGLLFYVLIRNLKKNFSIKFLSPLNRHQKHDHHIYFSLTFNPISIPYKYIYFFFYFIIFIDNLNVIGKQQQHVCDIPIRNQYPIQIFFSSKWHEGFHDIATASRKKLLDVYMHEVRE